MFYYEDQVIKIRDIKASDIRYLFQWWIDDSLNSHDPRPFPNDTRSLLKSCEDYCKRMDEHVFNEDHDKNTYKYFVILDSQDRTIGYVNLFSFNKVKKEAELGIMIGDKSYWGQGIGSKAVSVVTNYMFDQRRLTRIYIETGETNKKAQKLFLNNGFVNCGSYIEEDEFKFIVMEKIKLWV